MAKLIAVIGNVGVGKTTLAQRLCSDAGYALALEQHTDRSFHQGFATNDHSLALPNQIDYLLLRAEQEQQIRAGTTVGVMDGGLEQDFWVFTQYFYQTGRLRAAEYDLCHRLYRFARYTLPPPDLIVALKAPINVLLKRYNARNRAAEVIKATDIPALEPVVQEYVRMLKQTPVISVNADVDDPGFVITLAQLRPSLETIVGN